MLEVSFLYFCFTKQGIMALEDICKFSGTQKWFSSPLESTVTTNHCTSFGFCGLKKLPGSPLDFFIPNSASLNHKVSVQRPFALSHGTTTLGFVFQGGVIAAADTRASAGGLVACPSVQKITPIHSHLVVTSSGSGADCMLWERLLIREIRLYQLRNRLRLSIRGTAKLLSFMLHPFKGTDVCVALTLCGWDKDGGRSQDPSSSLTSPVALSNPEGVAGGGPRLIYVCSDGARLQGEVMSVGSGSPYAYGVLDAGLRWSLSKAEAVSLAREAVFRATHRDAYSGNNVDLYHITEQGWTRRQREDLREEYYTDRRRKEETVEENKRGTEADVLT